MTEGHSGYQVPHRDVAPMEEDKLFQDPTPYRSLGLHCLQYHSSYSKNNIENYKLGHSRLFGQQIYGIYIIMLSGAVEIKS